MRFNPIKQEVDGKIAHDVIWSTEIVDKAIEGLNAGKKLVANPFYENNTKLLKGDLVFERTQEEIEEWRKCADDILYFANTYCKLMTPQGIKNVTMRDYQEEYLEHLVKNRLSIFLSCRQSGKCLSFLTRILIDTKDEVCQQFKKSKLKCYYINENKFEMPFFELYNLYNNSFKWKIKYHLYKLIYKLLCLKEKVQQKKINGKI